MLRILRPTFLLKKLGFDEIAKAAIALISLWAGTIAVLQNQVNIESELSFRRAQSLAVSTFGQLTRTDERVTHNLGIYAAWTNARLQVDQAEGRAKAARLQGDELEAQKALTNAARWRAVQKTSASLTPLLSDKYNGNYTSYYEQEHYDAYLEQEKQLAATRESAEWSAKSSRYSTALSVIAVALFLMGIALTVKNRVKFVLAFVGLIMLAITVEWVIEIQSDPVIPTPVEAMERFVEGQILSNTAYKATGKEKVDLETKALADFDRAIQLYDQYADAYQWKGMTLLQTRLLDADGERNAQAAQSLERAVELGNDTSVVHTNLGWAYLLIGKYQNAITALKKAVEVEPTECQAHLNLGLAYLANAQTAKANETYADAR
ncbi:MAG: tetratricopeptide repeat protein, partial [Chloroflexi bacterium]|nr:tetratricopeptide repeat protein [Chloroflexota bacterium]